ncbi:DUF1707 domain-containing protein [Actinoplanes sp. N902-109]|uniref:DUF1707 SHOCT-like domain-containing protein n=1 Tax=Actinoplanes sp. (strain N902-109) TaxID=649831 RepID=UPI0003296087|nr:DUF1707 domain-containing protein [Actinoplanes sp. N902-109]AGL14457.1 hypothetical protein L083_0947 [Actinoplanes sp. N902-109]
MGREDMRAGDADRQAVAETLKTALDEGRLDLHEYDERLQRAYAAKTYGDLDSLTTDLPGVVPAQRAQVRPVDPAAPAAVPDPGVGEMPKPGGPPWLASYGGVIVLCVIIWAVSSIATRDLQYFWPAWMLFPFVLGLLGRRGRRDR